VSNGWYIDDRLYLYALNFQVCEPQKWDVFSRALLSYFEQGSYTNEEISIFRFRYEYGNNYAIHTAATCLARTLLPQEVLRLDYGTWIYAITQIGVALSHLICFAVVLGVLWYSRDHRMHVIILLALIFLVASAVDIPNRNARITGTVDPFLFLVHAIIFTMSPGFEFEIFGITPRSDATLLLIAVTVLRWQRRANLAYWIIAFTCLLHGTYAMLMLAIFLSLDLILQPAVLRDRRTLLPIAITVMATLVRAGSFEVLDGMAIQLGGIVLGLVAAGAAGSIAGERLMGMLPPVSYLRRIPLLHAETLLLLTGMVFSIVLSLVLTKLNSGLTVKYVAHELSGRPIALMRVPLLLGVCAILVRAKYNGLERHIPVAVAVMALATIGWKLSQIEGGERGWRTAAEMEDAITTTLSSPERTLSKLQVYYIFACRIDDKCSYLKELTIPLRQ
jgi:hypothetical protein